MKQFIRCMFLKMLTIRYESFSMYIVYCVCFLDCILDCDRHIDCTQSFLAPPPPFWFIDFFFSKKEKSSVELIIYTTNIKYIGSTFKNLETAIFVLSKTSLRPPLHYIHLLISFAEEMNVVWI